MSEMSACLHCGGTSKLESFYDTVGRVWDSFVECMECGAVMPVLGYNDREVAERDVIEKWNRRSYE